MSFVVLVSFLVKMSPLRDLLFRRGSNLSVVGESGDFWLCKARQHVYHDSKDFEIRWYESVSGKDDTQYDLIGGVEKINLSSVIGKVSLKKVSLNKSKLVIS